jgi:alpha-L-fucosidase 2
LHIQGADAVTFILTTATSYINYTNINGNPAAICEQILSRSAEKDYATLRHRHDNDFRGLMSRVHLNVGDISMNEKPIDERLKAVRAGGSDPNLEALVFQFGRYILAASSRAGGQPANLQGIWNEDVIPPWGSKYTININTEMNYWPAEVCNLSECAQPLFDMIKDISVNGAETAKRYYGCGGWVTHQNIDLWRGTAPVDAARFGMWPVGGAWLCQHLWEHYAFTGDTQFLRDYYPVIKGAAQFLLEVMVEEPKHHTVLDVTGTRLSGWRRKNVFPFAVTNDGCRDHPRTVSALHRSEPNTGLGRELSRPTGNGADKNPTLPDWQIRFCPGMD